MFELEQACIEKTEICLDCPSGPPKCQIYLDCHEITIFAWLSVSTQTNYVIIHSPSIPSALVPAVPNFPQPFFRAATI